MPTAPTDESARSRSPRELEGHRICGLCNQPQWEPSFVVPRGEGLLGVCHICYLLEDLQTLVKSIPNGRTRVILEDGLQVLWETARTRVTEDQASSRAVAQSRDGP